MDKTTRTRRRIAPLLAAALAIAQLAPGFLLSPEPAQAVIADGAPAIDVLGQFDPTPSVPGAFEPDFTRGGINGGPYAFSVYNRAQYIDIDAVRHRLFVIDAYDNRVLVYNLDSNNEPVDTVADYVLGQADMYSAKAATTSSGMNYPTALEFDSGNNRLFVSDGSNNRILVFDLSGGITDGMAASNVLGQANFTTGTANRGGSVAANTLYVPYDMAWDSVNGLLISVDYSNNRILVFDLSGGITDGMAASNVLGQANFTTGTANRGGSVAANTLKNPIGIELDSPNNRLWVADHNNHRILAYDLTVITDGENAVNVLGQANFTTGTANRGGSVAANTLSYPFEATWDSISQRLFVVDDDSSRVLVFNLSGGITDGMAASNVLGQANFTTGTANRGGSVAANTLYWPIGAFWDSENSRFWVTDGWNNRILAYDLSGGITDGMAASIVLGQPASLSGSFPPAPIGSSFSNNYLNGGPVAAQLYRPNGVARDTAGRHLFVSDTYNSRVLVFDTDASGRQLDRIADHVLGQADFTSGLPNRGGSVAANTLNYPYALTWDSSNSRLFVADKSNSRVLVYNLASGITDGMNASSVLGQADFISGSINRGGSVAANTLRSPFSLFWDSSSSRLFVADTYNSRVLAYDLTVITDGENAVNVLGQANFTTGTANRGGSVAANSLYYPTGLVWDQPGSRLFVADYVNNRVLAYDLSVFSDGEAASNVLGQANFTAGSANRGGSVAANSLYFPGSLSWDSSNSRLFVADVYNSRVLAYDLTAITDGENAVNVLGQANFTSGSVNRGGNPAANTLSGPSQIFFDASSLQLFVSDETNNRVLTFDASTSTGTTTATSNNRVALSRLQAGESATFSLSFDLAHVLSSTLTVTFPAGFTVTAPATTAGGASSSCLSNFGFTSNTLTADKTLCGGPIVLGGASVTLPGTPGAYTISWVNDDPGEATVIIVSDDQLTVNATVDPVISFLAIALPAASTCSSSVDLESQAADYAVALGALNVSTLTVSRGTNADSEAVDLICTQGSTNATGGIAVTVRNANGASGLVSSSVPTDTIAGTTASGMALAPGSPGYGICLDGTLTHDSGLNPAGAAPASSGDYSAWECDLAAGNVAGLSTSAETLWSASGPTQDATGEVLVRVAISATQPAHNDYTDSLTFVGTATY